MNKVLVLRKGEDEWVAELSEVIKKPDRFNLMARAGQKIAQKEYSLETFKKRVIKTFTNSNK